MDTRDAAPEITPGAAGDDRAYEMTPLEMCLAAVTAVARYHGIELDRNSLRVPGEATPEPAVLVQWLRDQGLVAKASRLAWAQLTRLTPGAGQAAPVVLLFKDGSAGVLVGSDTARNIVWVRDPRSTGQEAVAVDRCACRRSGAAKSS